MRVDAVLIMGKELLRDPERARRELAARAAAASAALRCGAEVIYTLEARLRGQERSGSHIVREYLLELGVPEDRIVARAQTRCTREEAREGAALVRSRGHRRLGVITASYHVPRTRLYFSRELGPGQFEVVAPENFIQRARPAERVWIEAGTPSAQTLEREGRLESALLLAGRIAGRLPAGRRLEAAAAALLRG